jgi:signal transduction histidine kinase
VLLLSSCGSTESQDQKSVDYYNTISYEARYSNIDSSYIAAKKAYSLSENYENGRCEALNNLAYVYYQQMKYDHSIRLLRKVLNQSRNQIELLCSDVMMMKVMQRVGNGYDFFKCRNRALNRLARINENYTNLTERQMRRVYYANTELHIVSSTYYYYLGQDSLANDEINAISDYIRLDKDTTQFLYYHYMLGSGGLLKGNPNDVKLQEFDHLLLTYTLSKAKKITYFEANSLQSFAEMFIDSVNANIIKQNRRDSYNYIKDQVSDNIDTDSYDMQSALPIALALRSLRLFYNYKDLFQTACLYRTLGDIYFANGNYPEAHKNYNTAMSLVHSQERRSTKSIIAWMAGIHERLSLSYSSLGNKPLSDYHRNIYLDLLDDSRQNKELNIRKETLSKEVRDVHVGIGILILLMFFITILIVLYVYRIKHNISSQYVTLSNIKESDYYNDAIEQIRQFTETLETNIQALTENNNIGILHIEDYQNENIIRRAKVSLVYAIVPYLNRILAESKRMKSEGKASTERLTYIRELIAEITRINDVLTEWIKMQKGMLNLHISTFSLSNIFNILKLNTSTYKKKNISLVVPTTDYKVKADETLTLFMVNTLADNARKFTNPGGKIEIALTATEESVEISIIDTGIGLSEEDVNTLNNSNIYDSSHLGISNDNKGFGFGIMNCKGIINKYKKLSTIFAVCDFGAESQLGKGSRFWFRLPRVLCFFISFILSVSSFAKSDKFNALFDSTYAANIEGRYEDALLFAERALKIPEIQSDTLSVVQLRNEMAIASQALNRWDDYRFNNNECVRLHWLYSQDTSLASYCKQMEEAKYDSSVLFVLLAISCVVILCLIYIIFLKDRIKNKDKILTLQKIFTSTLNNLQLHIETLKNHSNSSDFDIIKQNADFVENLKSERDKTSIYVKDDNYLAGILQGFYKDIINYIGKLNDLQTEISNLSEQNNKIKFEEDRLYVMNQVLDNSLSTIKHETMYYPARIDQISQNLLENENNTQLIAELNDLVLYYKELYLLLYEQADRQLLQSNFHDQKINCQYIVSYVQKKLTSLQKKDNRVVRFTSSDINNFIRCDEKLLKILLDNIIMTNWHEMQGLQLLLKSDNNILNLYFTFNGVVKNENEIENLFYPSKDNFSYYIIRQIIREHDARYGYPGLRLDASQGEEGLTIHFSLVGK